jgi:hypothetical protein
MKSKQLFFPLCPVLIPDAVVFTHLVSFRGILCTRWCSLRPKSCCCTKLKCLARTQLPTSRLKTAFTLTTQLSLGTLESIHWESAKSS